MDPTLTAFDEDEANRIIGVALLCTQSSPLLRPTMSRAVAMLAGDIEISAVTVKPSYLTDWDFKDITSELLDEGDTQISVASKNGSAHDHGQYYNDDASKLAPSPIDFTEPTLHEVIGDGRWSLSVTGHSRAFTSSSSFHLLSNEWTSSPLIFLVLAAVLYVHFLDTFFILQTFAGF